MQANNVQERLVWITTLPADVVQVCDNGSPVLLDFLEQGLQSPEVRLSLNRTDDSRARRRWQYTVGLASHADGRKWPAPAHVASEEGTCRLDGVVREHRRELCLHHVSQRPLP